MVRSEVEKIYLLEKAKLIALARRFRDAASVAFDEEDVVQDAFIAFWKLYESGYPVRNPEALLVAITKNICISNLRKRKMDTEPLADDRIIGDETIITRLDDDENYKIKMLLYECLTDTERKCMLLKTEKDMSVDQIVKETGSTKGAIKTALSKANKKLKHEFRKKGYGSK